MSDLPDTVDVAIIGSGIGGSTIACGLAVSGARIAILERGFHLGAHPAARDARAIFQRGVFRPVETWLYPHGHRFNPGNADSGGSRPRIRDDVAHHSDLI